MNEIIKTNESKVFLLLINTETNKNRNIDYVTFYY